MSTTQKLDHSTTAKAATAKPASRKILAEGLRLTAEERKARIVEEATNFFAEYGFEGSTSNLARRLGITQPLLYRYFPTKEDLIEHVYEHAFPSAVYYPKWKALLQQQEVPIRERLIAFYREYSRVLLNYKFLRLAVWAGLSRTHLDVKYSEMLTKVFFPEIIFGLRASCGSADRTPPTTEEIELVQSLHGSIYYLGIRRWVTNRLTVDTDDLIATKIDLFLDGALTIIRNRPRKAAKRISRNNGRAKT